VDQTLACGEKGVVSAGLQTRGWVQKVGAETSGLVGLTADQEAYQNSTGGTLSVVAKKAFGKVKN